MKFMLKELYELEVAVRLRAESCQDNSKYADERKAQARWEKLLKRITSEIALREYKLKKEA